MTAEVWRVVPSCPELSASSLGRIVRAPFTRSMPKGGARTYASKPTFGYLDDDGRRIIRIQGLGKTFRISRLVCEAFHGPPPTPSHVAMHADDDASNNRPNNLSWGTQKQNLNAPGFLAYCRTRKGSNRATRL